MGPEESFDGREDTGASLKQDGISAGINGVDEHSSPTNPKIPGGSIVGRSVQEDPAGRSEEGARGCVDVSPPPSAVPSAASKV